MDFVRLHKLYEKRRSIGANIRSVCSLFCISSIPTPYAVLGFVNRTCHSWSMLPHSTQLTTSKRFPNGLYCEDLHLLAYISDSHHAVDATYLIPTTPRLRSLTIGAFHILDFSLLYYMPYRFQFLLCLSFPIPFDCDIPKLRFPSTSKLA